MYVPNVAKRVHFKDEVKYKDIEVCEDEDEDTDTELEKTPSVYSTFFAVVGYMLSSALLLLINKITIHELPLPCFVLFTQLFSSALVTRILGVLDVIEVEPLRVSKIRRFWLVPVAFMLTIYSNVKILQHANVETFIVFRASTPILLSILEPWFLGRALPDRKSTASLLVLLAGAVAYVVFEHGQLSSDSIFWVICWYSLFCFDQLFIKHVVDTVEMSTWTRVYYTNALPVIPLFFVFLASGEYEQLVAKPFITPWLLASWVFGTSISFFGFLTREALSATSFTLVGNTCKVLTVLSNLLFWDRHAGVGGVGSLLICLLAAYVYKPAEKLDQDQHKRLKADMWMWIPVIFTIIFVSFVLYAYMVLIEMNKQPKERDI